MKVRENFPCIKNTKLLIKWTNLLITIIKPWIIRIFVRFFSIYTLSKIDQSPLNFSYLPISINRSIYYFLIQQACLIPFDETQALELVIQKITLL